MMPNRWKSLAFCLGLSVAGLATCADQPNSQLHKPTKMSEPALLPMTKPEEKLAIFEEPMIKSPALEASQIQVREFIMDVPELKPDGSTKAPQPTISVPEIKLDVPEMPAIRPVNASVPIVAPPIKLEEPKPIEINAPKPEKVPEMFSITPLEMKDLIRKQKAEALLPENQPVAPFDPIAQDIPVEVKPVAPQQAPKYVESSLPKSEPVRVEAKPVSIPKPDAPAMRQSLPKTENVPVGSNRLKLIITLGDGKPRFEVKNIVTNQTVLKATGSAIEISKFAPTDERNPMMLQKLLASGDIHFTGPDIEGVCDELSILAGTGEVLLKGTVQMKTRTSKNWTTLHSDKVVYQIGDAPVAINQNIGITR